MPLNNKFQKELELELIRYEPSTLIVGTFNPDLQAGNPAEWFYGRTAGNYFWDVLPRLYGERSLITATAGEWRQFCTDKKIAITDMISSIDDAEPGNREHVKILSGFSDKAIAYNFDDFTFVNIVQVLRRHPTIRNVYFTRGITEAFWRHVWNPVIQYCNRNGLHERRLLMPTDDTLAQYQVYNEQHPENKVSQIEDYILMKWQQEWHF